MTTAALGRAARALDRTVNTVVCLVLASALLFSGYQVWDAWRVQHHPDDVAARLMAYKGPHGPSFRELLAINPDVVAWVELEGTRVDGPVVQGKDDFEYLSTDVFGDPSPSGSLFLAHGCSPDFSDPYSVVMGHHMAEGKMFGDLDLFRRDGFLDSHHEGTLWLPDETLDLEVAAVLAADAYDPRLYGLPVGEGQMAGVCSRVAELALATHGEPVGPDDRLVALSTCASGGVNERTVVVCRVVGAGPAEDSE